MNRRHRLRGRGRFAAVRRSGVEARCGVVRVRALASTDAAAHAGIAVVGARSAVERNRARRRARAVLGHVLPELSAVDAVVWVQAAASRLDQRALEAELGRAVRSAARRCAPA
ncbi:MAG TPA: ribonuclease P protein component [Candidatus Dormibacteraeota bacterium]|nr:ribonuclease P protein component [Candidatus Dormibacteraeota bacterium]